MYKSSYQKQDKNNFTSGRNFNFLSPPSNQNSRQNPFYNSNMPKVKPVNLYSKYLSPNQNDKNFSVKNVSSPDDKLNQDLLNKFSNYQKNESGKMLRSPTSNNSDLLTMDTMTQRSNESFISNINGNNMNFIPMPNNFTLCQFPNHRYNYSMTTFTQMSPMNYFYPQNNNTFLNGNYNMNMNLKYCNNNIKQSTTNIIYKKNKNNQENTTSKITNNKYKKNNQIKNNKSNSNNSEDEKIDLSNFNSNNSIKSGSGSGKSEKSGKSSKSNKTNKSNSDSNQTNKTSSINNMTSTDSINGKSEKMLKYANNKGGNKHYNKFNPPKENNTINENTVILTVSLKVGPNDFRTFNLKKYDDLFISLEKFFDLHKIKQDLVKPIVTKIFDALNKTFWLLNNKIGIYDQEYLNSLYKLWKKNNEQIPKRNNSQEEETKSNGGNKKGKSNSDKSTISSSDSSDGDKNHKKILSNSFQNLDNSSSEDAKEGTCNSV